MQKVFEACNANKLAAECQLKEKIRTAETNARLDSGYYAKNSEERAALDKTQAAANAAKTSELAAAFLKDNEPAGGKEGGACKKKSDCTETDHCCGTAIPKTNAPGVTTGQQTGRCASMTTKGYKDGLGVEFTHTCGASKLVAAAGAILSAVYLM